MMTPAIARIQKSLIAPTPAFMAVLLVSGVACDAGSFVEPQDGSWQIQASTASHTFTALEQKEKFTAQALNEAGEPVPGATFHWASSDGAVATVDQTGIVTAKAPGATTIEVASDCCAGTDTIRILIEQVPATLSLSPREADVGVGQTLRMDADVRDANGYPIADVIDFASDNAGVVAVAANGDAEALSPGTATISAKAGKASGTARVNVEKSESVPGTGTATTVTEVRASTDAHYFPALGLKVSLSAEALDGDGNPVKNESITWSSLDTGVATVSPSGRVTAEGVGSTAVVVAADCCAAADTVAINIEQVPAEVTVSPSQASLEAGGTVRLEAEATDANGFAIPGAVSFSSSAKGVATVASDGTVEAVAAGSASITAAAGDASAKTSVVVEGSESGSGSESEPLVAEVRATPTRHTFEALGQTLQLSAEALDGTGHTVADVTFKWTSSNTNIATVNSMGLVTAKSVGTAAIVVAAICCSASDTVAITVQQEGAEPAGGLWFSDGFESGNTGHTDNGFRWNNTNFPVSSEHAYSGTKALKFHYPGKPRGQDHNSELRFTIASDAASAPKEIWVEYMFRVPDNFVHRNEWKEFGQDEKGLVDGGIPFTGSMTAGSDILTLDQAGAFPDYIGGDGKQAVRRWQADVPGAGEGGAELVNVQVTERISDTKVRLATAASKTVSGVDVDFRVVSGLNNKFFLVWAEKYSGMTEGVDKGARFTLEYEHENPRGPGDVTAAYPRYALTPGLGESNGHNSANRLADIFRTEDRGKWVRLRYHLLIHDTDGQFETWRDGTKVAELKPGTRTSWGDGYDYWRHGYLMGWANSGFHEDTTFYIDDFKVYTSDPGW